MAKKSNKRNVISKRRVIRRTKSSDNAKKAAVAQAAVSAKQKGFWGWIKTPAVPRAKGIHKLAPKHIWQVYTSKKALKLYAIALLTGFLTLAAIFAWFAKDLPSPNKINAVASAQTTKLFDRTGEHLLVEIYGDKNRSIIEFNQMPKCIKDATVDLEDKDFYSQGAFSPKGLARAFSGILFKDPSKGGGSTITQQYVKNALLTDQRSYARKIKELILAIEIEQLYKKDDILKLYLNEIPYGSTAYGIQAASKQFFGIDAKDLSLSQCALIASLPQAPTYYSPYGQHKPALIAKRNRVIDLMMQQHHITQAQADAAKLEDNLAQLKPYNPYANVTAPHFVAYVREQLEEKYGVKAVEEGGLKVVTTLDLDKQRQAEDAIAKNMRSVRATGGSNAALVSEDPQTGQILAMVGSYNYGDPEFGSFNVADAPRQPGSSFKPIVYANLLKGNYGAGTTFYDVKTDFGGGYTPKNYSGRN
jgi:membrane peptidoglycan carboxypeptidase